jgi:hypothetical protein
VSVHPDEPLVVLDDDWDFDDPLDDEPGVRRPRRRALVGLVAVAGFLLASVIVTTFDEGGTGPARPDTSGLASVEPGNLPDTLTQAWSTRFAGTGSAVATSLLVEDDLAVVVIDDGSRDRSLVAAVDGATGEQLWRRSFAYSPSELDPLLVEDGVLVIEQDDRLTSNRLIGLAAADGSDRWERRMRGVSFNGVLDGTTLVANIDRDESTETAFYAPSTGEPVGSIGGDVTTTDLDGTWYFATGSTLASVELADGWTEPVSAAELRAAGEQRVVSVDGRLITTDALGRLAEIEADGALTAIRADDVAPITAMWPSGGRTFVGIGDGQVVGIELLRDAAVMTWRRDGAVRQFGLTDEGVLLVIGDPDSDTRRFVIDGATGDELGSFAPQDPGGGSVRFASNGFVTSPNGSDHEAFDLGGNPLWKLDDVGKLAVGDDIVVALAKTPSGFRLTGYQS